MKDAAPDLRVSLSTPNASVPRVLTPKQAVWRVSPTEQIVLRVPPNKDQTSKVRAALAQI